MSTEERSVPYYCPYCAGEDLRPYAEPDAPHGWECRECTRVFTVKLIGLALGSRNQDRGAS